MELIEAVVITDLLLTPEFQLANRIAESHRDLHSARDLNNCCKWMYRILCYKAGKLEGVPATSSSTVHSTYDTIRVFDRDQY